MIRLSWTFLLLFLSVSILYGQQNYLLYHQDISEAEQQIANKEYKEALSTYGNVFDLYDFVLLSNYKVASQLVLLLKDKEKAFQYPEPGVLKDCSPKSTTTILFPHPMCGRIPCGPI